MFICPQWLNNKKGVKSSHNGLEPEIDFKIVISPVVKTTPALIAIHYNKPKPQILLLDLRLSD